ncbi:LOW QUALITY PROTEIN: hypothetical protein Smp_047410 [Schistosoma mansoni]|uniref:hypothetical protein n=1 Tax=Schistosoma mansoni TaxID=6183 RepID=UPI00022DC54D|nr:LOW QUALITY PROTEIN: hypothetical protein Smp_047410 [Schistosoma mansoni]|eukprot:XP_018649885.1 LOW QUALITY PROTEIN: hypothetical protein Smp_047410 [Schistosoma mansoni]
MSEKMCQCHCTKSLFTSEICEKDKLPIQPTSSVDNIICQTPNTSTPFHSYPSTFSSSSAQITKHYQTSSLICCDTSCSRDVLLHRNQSSSILNSQTYCSVDEQFRVDSECQCNFSTVHPFKSHLNKQQEKCLSRRGYLKLLTRRPYLKKTKQK